MLEVSGIAGDTYRNTRGYSAIEEAFSYPYVDPAYAPGQLFTPVNASTEFLVGTRFTPPFNIPAPWDFFFDDDPKTNTEGYSSGAPKAFGEPASETNKELIVVGVIGILVALYIFRKRI